PGRSMSTQAVPSCPKCGGDMWDERLGKFWGDGKTKTAAKPGAKKVKAKKKVKKVIANKK
ncbi:MAG: hypothetical protein UY89_C0009G0041, partial [Parcubacteria group bacterium GW2011_GWA1_54_9]